MGAFISKQLPPLLRRTEGTAALDVARSGYGFRSHVPYPGRLDRRRSRTRALGTSRILACRSAPAVTGAKKRRRKSSSVDEDHDWLRSGARH